MKLTDIILREGVEKRMINFLDDMHRNKQTISVAAFMKEFGVDKQEARDFIHKWNISKVDRSVMEDGHGDGYEEGNIKLMGDIILPAYWADKFEPYPIEVEIDGKSVAKEAKVIKLLFHPEMDEEKGEFKKRDKNEGRSLSEPSDEMEKVIDSGISISGDMDNIKDVMYYVHNNWMGGDISAEEAMKKISKYIR